jgi:hypothetical protein
MRPVGAELIHADRQSDGRTDRFYEANSGFAVVRTRLIMPRCAGRSNELK